MLKPRKRFREHFCHRADTKQSTAYLKHALNLADDLFGRYDRVSSVSSRDVTDDVIRRPQRGVELSVRVDH